MSTYTSNTRRAVFMTARKGCTISEVDAKFTSIAAAYRFISGYNPTHLAWNGGYICRRKTTYDALQAILKREGYARIDIEIDDIPHRVILEYVK